MTSFVNVRFSLYKCHEMDEAFEAYLNEMNMPKPEEFAVSVYETDGEIQRAKLG